MVVRILRGFLMTVGLLTVLGLAAVGVGLTFLVPWLQYEDEPVRADYILPLAGDQHRLLKAAELYQRGLAPTLLLSNNAVHPPTRLKQLSWRLGYPKLGAYEYRGRLLALLGVPEEATDSFGHGHVSTVEEAEALKRYLGPQRATVLLVTSPYHARRAKIIFANVMPNVTFKVLSPPEGRLEERWWRDQSSAQLAVSELTKLVFYWLGGAFRAAPGQGS